MKKFIFASFALLLMFTGCASNEAVSSNDDISQAVASDVTTNESSNATAIDTSALNSDLPPASSAQAAPAAAPVPVIKVAVVKRHHRRHGRHHRKHLAVHKKHRKHRKHYVAK
jgi:hypothetical protein